MPARAAEIHHAEEEGIEFHLLTAPTRFLGDENGRVVGIRRNSLTAKITLYGITSSVVLKLEKTEG